MLTKIAVEKTYWLGMSAEQKDDLINFVREFDQSDIKGLSKQFSREGLDALNDLRECLLSA